MLYFMYYKFESNQDFEIVKMSLERFRKGIIRQLIVINENLKFTMNMQSLT